MGFCGVLTFRIVGSREASEGFKDLGDGAAELRE